ncbi:MAG: hypothetical protein U1D35_11180 [Paracoccaceae bacterium]|nr:hypothetical protein [Paracoccaceae bacterium]
MPIIDKTAVAMKTGSICPAPYGAMMDGRSNLRLGEAGALSSLPHWHMAKGEFAMVTHKDGRPYKAPGGAKP